MNPDRLFENRMETRDIPFTMRLTPSEVVLLREMAQEARTSRAGIVRSLIRLGLNFKDLAGNAGVYAN
jgi:hypothetical protein